MILDEACGFGLEAIKPPAKALVVAKLGEAVALLEVG